MFIHGILSGHGGSLEAQREGYKMHRFPNGKVVYEGIENRRIKLEILKLARIYDIQAIDLNSEVEDTPLPQRVAYINLLHKKLKEMGNQLLLWEIHGNASGVNAKGREVYTTKLTNFSDTLATEWSNVFNLLFPTQIKREDFSDGDPDKEKDFYVIKNSNAYGVLCELCFFDSSEADFYYSRLGRRLIAQGFIEVFERINEKYK